MPVERSEKSKVMRQLTLTGKPAPPPNTDASSSVKSKSGKSKVERAYTDAILCIRPEFTELIASRKKNHEYRKYKLRPTAARLWLYEVAPVCAITYVVITGSPKEPGQIKDPSGIGNDDFDMGLKESKFGYPVLGLYQLQEPLKSDVMKSKYGIVAPQGYLYAPKKLVDEMPLETMTKLF